jgi:uncharacterized protein YbjT (DUF2867 family)
VTVPDAQAPVLVLGGTGHLGRFVVAALLERGQAVRVLSRDPGRARELLGEGVEILEGDLCDPASVAPAMAGVERAVVTVSAMSPATFRRSREIECDAVIAALQQGMTDRLRRVVLISIFDLDLALAERLGIDNARIKHDLETWLAGSGLAWTVLGQPPSMEALFAFIRGGRIMAVPGGGPPRLPTIAPQDSGALAAEAVLREDLCGLRIRLVPVAPVSLPEAAQRIGAVWGRQIRFVAPPLFIPIALRWLISPLAAVNDKLGFVHELLGYLRLLNAFPSEGLDEDRVRLAGLFERRFTSIEEEAEARRPEAT